jgi:hypothetical protein
VFLNGDFVDPMEMDPLLYDLPRAGILKLDFVSYDMPAIPQADLLCKLSTPRMSIFRVKPPTFEAPRSSTSQPEPEAASEAVARVASPSQLKRNSKGEGTMSVTRYFVDSFPHL